MKAWLNKYWLPIVLVIAFSIFIRPYINSKISNNNHNLIITLTAVENWLEEGIDKHGFNLIHSWSKPGDEGLHYYPRVMNDEGRNYFVSYPPLSFITFYTAVKLVNPQDLVSFFKLFGAVLHVLTFWLILVFLRKKIDVNLADLFAGLFLFFPAGIVLSNMYYPEQLILLLIVLTLFVFEFRTNKLKSVLLFILGFLLIYCDWLGFLVVASYFLHQIFIKKNKISFEHYTLVIGGVIGGVVLLLHYSSINGFEGLFHGLKVRYLERSGVFSEKYSDRGVNLLSSNSIHYLLYHLLPVVLGVLVVLFVLRPKVKTLLKSSIMWIVIIPVVLHMVFLFNSNILHFQNLAKLSLIFTIGLLSVFRFSAIKKSVAFGLLSVYIFSSCLIVKSYFNKYPEANETYSKSEFIKGELDQNLPVIMIQDEFSEDLVLLSYLLKRNVIHQGSEVAVEEFLKEDINHDSALCIDWGNRKVEVIKETPSL